VGRHVKTKPKTTAHIFSKQYVMFHKLTKKLINIMTKKTNRDCNSEVLQYG